MEMAFRDKHLVVVVVFAMLLMFISEHTCVGVDYVPGEPGTVFIDIVNGLSKSAKLKVHCLKTEGGQDDHGAQVVQPRSIYSFSFWYDGSGNTAYTCTFQWPPKNSHELDVFREDATYTTFGQKVFKWTISDEKSCLFDIDEGEGEDDCHTWR